MTAMKAGTITEKIGRARLGSTLRGKWRLDRIVGVGGMATVYEATHRNGSRVAVKMLHPTLSAQPSLCERFLREGYVANRVAHPGVPRVLDDDLDESDGSAFLVMELIDGVTLDERAKSCRPGDDEILRVARDVLQILSAAHKKGVIHRDLKPDNMLIDKAGRVRVLDFGIACLLEPDDDARAATTTGAAFGTPGFISPEQALGRRDLVGPTTDIYGLGATLFTLASGEFVHASEHPQELVVLAATKRARAVRSCAPQLSRDVAALIDKALQYAPHRRFATADLMLQEVERLEEKRRLARESATSRPVALVTRIATRRFFRSPAKGFAPLMMVGMASLAIGGVVFTTSLDSMRRAEARASQPIAHATTTTIAKQTPTSSTASSTDGAATDGAATTNGALVSDDSSTMALANAADPSRADNTLPTTVVTMPAATATPRTLGAPAGRHLQWVKIRPKKKQIDVGY